jgi:hypothetical protein
MEGLLSGMGSGHGCVGDGSAVLPICERVPLEGRELLLAREPLVGEEPGGALSFVVVDVSKVTRFSADVALEVVGCGESCTLGGGNDTTRADRTGWNPGGGFRGTISWAIGLIIPESVAARGIW